MHTPKVLYDRLVQSLEIPGLAIPTAFVRLYKHGEPVPRKVLEYEVEEETLTSCQALRHAMHGHPVFLTEENVGCIAAAISLGLVDRNRETPLNRPRLYTELMKKQSNLGNGFKAPSPAQFTSGEVYACKEQGKPFFCLFGPDDSGRFKDIETAQKAISNMVAIQPPEMAGVFFFGPDFEEEEVIPHVVVLAVRPVELTRLIQGYQFLTGEPVNAVLSPLRAMDSDLIARPWLTGQINVSSLCLGARLVAGFEGDRMGMGIPWKDFAKLVQGMEESRTGFPFHRYPGANPLK
ncbi:MAG: DUF169 domain-containing protein [Desulfatibacillum sp.]|nr:DUF169 domain-containing protein [Desulfatibacillum sp.]